MKRLNLMVPEEDYDWLYEHAEHLDVSVAEVVRSAVSFWKKMDGDPYAIFFEQDGFSPRDTRGPWNLPSQVLERLTRLEQIAEVMLTDKQRAQLQEKNWIDSPSSPDATGNSDEAA